MSQFNSLERAAAKVLSNMPRLKSFIKGSYQSLNYALNHKDYKYKLAEGLSLKKWAIQDRGSFGGYYDKSLLRAGKCLYHSFTIDRKFKDYDRPIDIVLDGKVLSSTATWNWQQGSMLSWLGKGTDWIIHNDFDGKKYISRIISTQGKIEQIIDFPIYQISGCGSFALSLNFTRLAKLRPDYGYFNLSTDKLKPIQADDGIYYVDLKSNKTNLLLSLKEISEFKTFPSMKNAWHKVNHIMLSPNNKRFMFLHRWYLPGGKKNTRLMTCNTDGTDLYVLLDDGMVSHCWWLDNERLISYASMKEVGDRYFLLNDRKASYSIIGEGLLTQDGHPSVGHDGRWLITDTYPDRSRMRRLLLFDIKSNEKVTIGEFLEPLRYQGQYRCDIHPRWSDNHIVTFDSTFSGIRKMYSIDITDIIKDAYVCKEKMYE